MKLHEPRNAFAIDVQAFELQLTRHASVAIVGMLLSQLEQALYDPLLQGDRFT